jgi:hypothetical protein
MRGHALLLASGGIIIAISVGKDALSSSTSRMEHSLALDRLTERWSEQLYCVDYK